MSKAVFLFLIAFCLTNAGGVYGAKPAKDETLGDRIVLEINNIVYTQRQLEVYVAIKDALKSSKDSTVKVVSANNWNACLDEFKQDMVVEQEAQRLGSFSPTDKMVAKGEEIFNDKLGASLELKGAVSRLGIDKPTIVRTIPSVLRVEAFKRGKEKGGPSASEENTDKERILNQISGPKPNWLVELESRAVYRLFDGATSYRTIRFDNSSPKN